MATSVGGEVLQAVDPNRIRFQHSKIRPYFSGCGRGVVETLDEIRSGRIRPSDLPPIQVLVGHTLQQKTQQNDRGRNPTSDLTAKMKKNGIIKGQRKKKDCSNDDTNGGDDDDIVDDGMWYFTLNNRRLWVLKRCREEGLLVPYGNKVLVRVRQPKSQQERERYTVENCALEARLLVEKKVSTTSMPSTPGERSKRDEVVTDNTDLNNKTTTRHKRQQTSRKKVPHADQAPLSPKTTHSVPAIDFNADDDEDVDDERDLATSNAFSALF